MYSKLSPIACLYFRNHFSYKCDSQCALEMRCPLGLVFDDLYQRCEWPGLSAQATKHRLSSLRNKKSEGKTVKKQVSPTTIKPRSSTVTPANRIPEP